MIFLQKTYGGIGVAIWGVLAIWGVTDSNPLR